MKAALKSLLTTLFIVLAFGSVAFGQLCTGSLGDPVVKYYVWGGSKPGAKTCSRYYFLSIRKLQLPE